MVHGDKNKLPYRAASKLFIRGVGNREGTAATGSGGQRASANTERNCNKKRHLPLSPTDYRY